MDETEIDTKMGSSLPKNQIIGTLCLKEILNHNLILRLMLSNEIGCCFPGKIRRFFSKGIAVVPHHLTLMFFSRRIWTWRRFSSLHQCRVGREVGGVRGDPKLCQFDVGKAILFYMGYMGNLPARIVGFTQKNS